MAEDSAEHVDVLVVGAGISGIDAAWHLQRRCPGKTLLILEARERIGGTWDLFRYPGVRSDSDMYTLGFPFRPWRGERSIVDGGAIRDYVEDTALAFGIDRRIRFRHKVVKASWSTPKARWTVEVESDGETKRFSCAFLFLCSGYYDYAAGYRPEWPDEEKFAGRIVHPQSWPDDLDHDGRRVVVIGSGATAVTLVPAMAKKAAKVTMLQRSPSYVVSRPSIDRLARHIGPSLTRWKNLLLGIYFFDRARKKPAKVRQAILRLAARALPPGYEVERHFSPSYDPWDQRLCLVPDSDLFEAISDGKVEVVTDSIDRFTESGVRLASGREIEADLVVTATGLVMKLMGGIQILVDGQTVNPGSRFAYKGMMLSGVPNLALSFGYTNASWTLKCDLTSRWVCRLLRHMDRQGYAIAMPAQPRLTEPVPMLDFSSGYVRRAEAILPKQGRRPPWRVHQNYLKDLLMLRLRPLKDEFLELRRTPPVQIHGPD